MRLRGDASLHAAISPAVSRRPAVGQRTRRSPSMGVFYNPDNGYVTV